MNVEYILQVTYVDTATESRRPRLHQLLPISFKLVFLYNRWSRDLTSFRGYC